jgi:hypothetical protein
MWFVDYSSTEVAIEVLKISTISPLSFFCGTPSSPLMTLATIDGPTSNQMSSVTAMVVWGDGSAPTILDNNQLTSASGTSLEVDVSHTYYTNGITCRYAIATTFYTDENYDTPIATVDSLAQVNGSNWPSLGPVSPTSCSEFEDLAASTGLEITLGRLFDGSVGYSNSPGAVLATFTDAAGPLSYSGTVQWETVNGVGQNTIATILPISGTADYRVFGDYTFLAVGDGIKSAIVTLRASDNAATSITVPIAVGNELSIHAYRQYGGHGTVRPYRSQWRHGDGRRLLDVLERGREERSRRVLPRRRGIGHSRRCRNC